MLQIQGDVQKWVFSCHTRTFAQVVLPYKDVELYIVPTVFDANSGKGEQRVQLERHAKEIAKAIQEGTYTPTPIAANLRRHHSPEISKGKFKLQVEVEKPLAQTDGGHRCGSIRILINERNDKLRSAEGEEAEKLRTEIEQLENLPIAVTLYFDGDSQQDFLNLQKGKTVDKAHEFSLSLRKDKNEPAYLHAFEAAKYLGRQKESPYHNCVRVDSKGLTGYPISTYCAKGSSDLATSLVGAAKVAQKKGPTFTAMAVIKCFDALEAHASHLLEANKPLTSVQNAGTRGSATMLLGLTTCLIYRMNHLGHDVPHEEDLERLIYAAKKTMNVLIDKNLSVGIKRKLIGEFAKVFFSDLEVEKHEGVPMELVRTLSASTFSLSRLPKRTPTPTPAVVPAKPRKENPTLFDETEFVDDEAEDPWKLPGDEDIFAVQEIQA